MNAATDTLVDELYRTEGKAEIVRGKIVRMSPTGGLPNYAGGEIYASLRGYARRTGVGYAVSDNTAFVVDLPHRKSFSPDAAYYEGELTMKFFQGAPLFAAEVRSDGDYGPGAEARLAAKRADYFAAGTQVVWDVDLLGDEVVRVFRASALAAPTVYRRGETAEGEPAVPGWTMPVDMLFP